MSRSLFAASAFSFRLSSSSSAPPPPSKNATDSHRISSSSSQTGSSSSDRPESDHIPHAPPAPERALRTFAIFLSGLALTVVVTYPLRHSDYAPAVGATLASFSAAALAGFVCRFTVLETFRYSAVLSGFVLVSYLILSPMEHPNSLSTQLLQHIGSDEKVLESIGSPVSRASTRPITFFDRPPKRTEDLRGRVCECTLFVRGSKYDAHVSVLYNKPTYFGEWNVVRMELTVEETGERIVLK